MSGDGREPRARSRRRGCTIAAIAILAVLVTLYVVIHLALCTYKAHGRSMEPAFEEGDAVLARRLSFPGGSIARGDVIVFRNASRNTLMIKRVIGLPGETIEIVDGWVSINGHPLDESAWLVTERLRDQSSYPARVIEADHYFVLGDNRAISNDSRQPETGTIAREQIESVVIRVVHGFYAE